MEETVTAADANRSFSKLLKGVRAGKEYVVTSHGTPVARLIPAGPREASSDRARKALLDHLARQPVLNVPRWTRAELYDD